MIPRHRADVRKRDPHHVDARNQSAEGHLVARDCGDRRFSAVRPIADRSQNGHAPAVGYREWGHGSRDPLDDLANEPSWDDEEEFAQPRRRHDHDGGWRPDDDTGAEWADPGSWRTNSDTDSWRTDTDTGSWRSDTDTGSWQRGTDTGSWRMDAETDTGSFRTGAGAGTGTGRRRALPPDQESRSADHPVREYPAAPARHAAEPAPQVAAPEVAEPARPARHAAEPTRATTPAHGTAEQLPVARPASRPLVPRHPARQEADDDGWIELPPPSVSLPPVVPPSAPARSRPAARPQPGSPRFTTTRAEAAPIPAPAPATTPRSWAAGGRPGVRPRPRPEPRPRRDEADNEYDEYDEYDDGPGSGYLVTAMLTAAWYAVPMALWVVYALTLGSTPQPNCLDPAGDPCGAPRAEALGTLAGAVPRLGTALGVSLVIAIAMRWANTTWRTLTIGFAASVVGAGIATVIFAAIGQPGIV
jgi:hypothetical protein